MRRHGVMIGRRLILTSLALLTANVPAGAPAGTIPQTDFYKFLCQIDLGENLPSDYPGLVLYTFDSHKQCSGSPSDVNIKLECSAQAPRPPAQSINQPAKGCSIAAAACGIAGG